MYSIYAPLKKKIDVSQKKIFIPPFSKRKLMSLKKRYLSPPSQKEN